MHYSLIAQPTHSGIYNLRTRCPLVLITKAAVHLNPHFQPW
jgi:hypothetical protein